MKHGVASLALLIFAQCAPRGEPPRPPPGVARVEPPLGDAPSPSAIERPREPGRPPEPLVVALAPFGRVVRMEERRPLWTPAAPRQHSELPSQRYERWHERQRTMVGYGYLSILDLTMDERFLLVASEEEAKLRTYEFPSLRPIASIPVEGYEKFQRGDFVFSPLSGEPRSAVFAGEHGLMLLDTAAPRALPLSAEPADTLRWTDDHRVLGATAAHIPEQRSRLTLYSFSPSGALETLLVLDFAERVEEWDLDSEKRKLAVTYYPSDQTEVLDLAARRVVWAAAAPQYASSVDISPDDSRVAVGGSSVVVHDMASGDTIAQDAHFGNNIHRVRFSPSGDALAVSSYEGKIRLFDAKGPGPALPLRKLLRHTGTANVYALVFTRDGSALVSGSGDRTVRVWGE